MSENQPHRSGIISSLLEVIRLRVLASPESRGLILQFAAEVLNAIRIDESLLLSIKTARIKIQRWEKEKLPIAEEIIE